MTCVKHLNACGYSLLLIANCGRGLHGFCFWQSTCAKFLTQPILEENGDYLCRTLICFKAIKFIIETARTFQMWIGFISFFLSFFFFFAARGLSAVAANRATLPCNVQASCSDLCNCGAQALDAWASAVSAHRLSSSGSWA